MKTTAKNARKEMIALVSEKGIVNITNGDISNLEKQRYTFREFKVKKIIQQGRHTAAH